MLKMQWIVESEKRDSVGQEQNTEQQNTLFLIIGLDE